MDKTKELLTKKSGKIYPSKKVLEKRLRLLVISAILALIIAVLILGILSFNFLGKWFLKDLVIW